MLETVNADADRVTRLITELLDISRIDSGRLDRAPAGRGPRRPSSAGTSQASSPPGHDPDRLPT